jgi:GrpB-like predicted nucleotidyltransferase (UPF0157 family)
MTHSLGLESGVVRIVEYDERWPSMFTAEAQRVLWACGVLPLRLEHIGATAVPGLCAKPVLDILAGRPAAASASDYIVPLQRVGYEHRGEQGLEGREFFRRGQPRAYHLHMVEVDGVLWRQYLVFRDYLCAHADAARRYADLKRSLAARFPQDREAYVDGKTAFVQEILRRAAGAA